jgi:hypothetical protein
VVKEGSADEAGMGLAAVLVTGIVSMTSISASCSLSEVVGHQLVVVSCLILVSGLLQRTVLVPHL